MTKTPQEARAEALEELRTNPTLKAWWNKIADGIDSAYYKVDELVGKVDEWFEPSEPKPSGGPEGGLFGSSTWEKTLRDTIDAARKRAAEQAKSAKQTNPKSGSEAFLDAFRKASEETREQRTNEQTVPMDGGLFTPCRVCHLEEKYHTLSKHKYTPLRGGF